MKGKRSLSPVNNCKKRPMEVGGNQKSDYGERDVAASIRS